MFTDLLIQAGLSEKEALVYENLLKLGYVPASKIIKATELKRPTVYDILTSLEQQGLVSQEKKGAKTYFWAEHPQKLYDLLDARVEKMESIRNSLDKLLPTLISKYNLHLHKPIVSYYEGREGLRKVFEDIYAPKKYDPIIWGCLDYEKNKTDFSEFVLKDLVPQRIKNKIQAKALLIDSKEVRKIVKDDKNQLRESILVDKKEYPLPGEIEVYEDKIAMLSFKKNNFVGIIIRNQDLAESLRSIFKLVFKKNRSV